MKRRSFIAAAVASVVAPLPMAAPTGAVSMASKAGRGMTTSILILDEAPFIFREREFKNVNVSINIESPDEFWVAPETRREMMNTANYQQPYGIPMKIGGTNA